MTASIRQFVVWVAMCGALTLFAPPAIAGVNAGPSGNAAYSTIPGSMSPTTDADTGKFTSGQMSVEILLAPRNAVQLSGLLTDLYNPSSANYKRWLRKGQFNALFAPSAGQIAAVASFLRASGLIVGRSSSPFVVRASGSSSAVEATFRTRLHTYRNQNGTAYFSNASALQLPTALAAGVFGVAGVSNTVRVHSETKLAFGRKPLAASSCEAPYPSRAQLYAAVNQGTPFPFGYGGGPGCNGLTPAQDNAIYGAPSVGPRGQGFGVNLAVFELSAYLRSDVTTWTQTFFGSGYRPPLVDVIVDGGPLSPICPPGDTCPPKFNGYAGDIEVDADIETQLAIAPAASHLFVYNAPNDFTGQTELDEYSQIANDNIADVISSSWGGCENDVGAAYALAENVIFEQMALQGQSIFSASGDTGAFDCIRGSGTTIPNVGDPSSQPWMTSVGGTSLERFNPGTNANPAYPAGGETVWNVDALCNTSANEGGHSGFFWCGATGAGGGGNSQYWGRPFFQVGPGVINPYTAYGNGTTKCSFAPVGTACREVPDVSANADEYTPYAEYCTGSAATPYSTCATFSGGQTPPGWFGIGGTSLSAPLWSAVFADRNSYQGTRSGNADQLLYVLYNANPAGYFHDITGIGKLIDINGLFPTTPGYDLASGIGSPKMSAIITGSPAP